MGAKKDMVKFKEMVLTGNALHMNNAAKSLCSEDDRAVMKKDGHVLNLGTVAKNGTTVEAWHSQTHADGYGARS
eukprot:1301550-Karenia_brevis.AAC.1